VQDYRGTPFDDVLTDVGQPFFCPSGHDFVLPARDELSLTDSAACPRCGVTASATPPGESEVMTDLRVRPSHWEQVRTRRTTGELEMLLTDALDRAGYLAPRV
jgi:hypothetical protein